MKTSSVEIRSKAEFAEGWAGQYGHMRSDFVGIIYCGTIGGYDRFSFQCSMGGDTRVSVPVGLVNLTGRMKYSDWSVGLPLSAIMAKNDFETMRPRSSGRSEERGDSK